MAIPLTPREFEILYADQPEVKAVTVAAGVDETLALAFEVKSFSPEQRTLEGYASTGHLDLVGDRVLPGAFAKSIAGKGPAGIQVYINHDQSQLPVGALLEIREDAKGLFTRTKIFETARGDELIQTTKELMSLGRGMSMSIGYRVPIGGATYEREGGKNVRKLAEVDLVEVSYTVSPANPRAKVVAVKQAPPATHDAYSLPSDGELDALFNGVVVLDGPPVERAKRLVRGYPIIWGTPDTSEQRDVILPNTFATQVAQGLLGLPLRINHEKATIGELVGVDADGVGLYCVWRLYGDDVFPQGTALLQQLHADMAEGTFAPLSAAYKVATHKTHDDQTSRAVTLATLSEVSLVLDGTPAQPEAAISGRRKSLAQMRAELEATDDWLFQQRMKERDQERRDDEHRRQQFAEAKHWSDHPPASVLKQRADEALAQARRELVEDDHRQVKAIDQAESRRCGDWDFRRSYDRQHPGGADRCPCRAHRLWRQELQPGEV